MLTKGAMQNDPYEVNNLYPTNHSSQFTFQHYNSSYVQSVKLGTLISRLDALLLVLKTCKARECTHPWEVLHPEGDVLHVYHALHSRFDDFYEVQQEKVSFSRCEKGYILDSEGPVSARVYSIEEIGLRGGRFWHELV